jgi:RNA polymerase primary sigma factor
LNKVILSSRIHKAGSLLEQELGRSPSSEELADSLNMELHEVDLHMGIKEQHVSLDTPFSEEGDGSLLDTLENQNADRTDRKLYHAESLKQEIDRSLQTLPDRHKKMLCYFYGIGLDNPLSLDDIGLRFDISPERVRQIKDKALSKLREGQNFNLLRSYLNA